MRAKLCCLVLIGAASAVASPAHAQLLTHRDLSYTMAKTIAETAIDSCAAKGYAVSAVVVDRDALGYLDTKVLGAGPARFQSFKEFRVAGDAGAAADQFDARALIDGHVPADLPQERRGEEAGHRAANDDGAALGATGGG